MHPSCPIQTQTFDRILKYSLSWRCHSLSGPVLRDTARLSERYSPIARYGVFGVSTWPVGRGTPSPFLSASRLMSMRSGGAIHPPHKIDISAMLARYPMKERQNACDARATLCDTISKGYCATSGGYLALGRLGHSTSLHDHFSFRKILAPIKYKSALPPPPKPPSKTWNFMDMGFPAERTHFFQASIKLAQPFPAPELRTRILRTRGFF